MGRSQSELLDGVPPMGRGRAAIGYRREARGERRKARGERLEAEAPLSLRFPSVILPYEPVKDWVK